MSHRLHRGYSLIELLVVLVIVGILAMVGVSMIGDRPTSAVRSVMDELEGTLSQAQKTASLTSQDVYLSTSGTWVGGNLLLDGRALSPSVSFPPAAGDLVAGDGTKRVGSNSECFRSLYPRSRDHLSAGVDTASWYSTALGGASDLKDVEPVKSSTELVNALASGNRLFTGSDHYAIVNGLTKRFEGGFSVAVVGLRDGQPIVGGPVGVIVVPANSTAIYKFYKSSNGSGWRRL